MLLKNNILTIIKQLVLYTYKVGGVTDEDFKMVEYLDAIPVAYSKKWIKKHKGVKYFDMIFMMKKAKCNGRHHLGTWTSYSLQDPFEW